MGAVDVLNEVVQAAASALKSTVTASINGINDAVKGVLQTANDLLSIVGQSVKIPQIAVPDMR